MFAPFKQPTVVTTILHLCTFEKCGDYKNFTLYILLRTRKRPPKFLKGKKITASNLTQHDSVSVASDLIAFEKYGMKFNGFPENFDSAVLTAYNELKNNPSKVNDYSELDRASNIN